MRHMETIIKRVKKGQLDKDSIEMAGAILKKADLSHSQQRQYTDWVQMR